MEQVWFIFKLLETLLGTICMGWHIKGFMNTEPLIHNLFYCGTFFGFTLYAMFGNLSICITTAPTPIMEAIVNLCAAVMYVAASIVTMYQAEKDFHLMYLSDLEEPLHPFFANSKSQSITALAAGALHMMHSVFAFDVILIKEDIRTSIISDDLEESSQPIKLYVFGKTCHEKLERFKWFRKLSSENAN